MMKKYTIDGREYVMGHGVLDTRGLVGYVVIDVAENRIISEHATGTEAVRAMVERGLGGVETQLAVAADYGPHRPLVITDTY